MKIRQTVVNYSIENEPYVAVVTYDTDLSLLDFVNEALNDGESEDAPEIKTWSDTKIQLMRNGKNNVVVFEVIDESPIKFVAPATEWEKETILERMDISYVMDQFSEDFSDEDSTYLLEIIKEALTNEKCQVYVDGFDNIKEGCIHEDSFADCINQFDNTFVDYLLESSDKFQAFKLLRT